MPPTKPRSIGCSPPASRSPARAAGPSCRLRNHLTAINPTTSTIPVGVATACGRRTVRRQSASRCRPARSHSTTGCRDCRQRTLPAIRVTSSSAAATRSEEHTSELQSQSNLVCRLLLEKKKRKRKKHRDNHKYKYTEQ